MNKTDLIEKVASQIGISKATTETVINSTLQALTEAMASGEKIQLMGFGVFEVKQRAARLGRNPRTREEVEISAKRKPVFTAGKTLKEAVE